MAQLAVTYEHVEHIMKCLPTDRYVAYLLQLFAAHVIGQPHMHVLAQCVYMYLLIYVGQTDYRLTYPDRKKILRGREK